MNTAARAEDLELEQRKVEAEERPHAATRARKVMAECNRVLVRAAEENELLRELCRIVVESGGYRIASIELVGHDPEKAIRPAASAGDDGGYLESVGRSWADNELGQGPAGLAVRSRKPQVARDLQTNPCFSARFGEVIAHGCRAAAALPLIAGDEVIGVMCILAGEAEAFDADELALLDELAHDIAYSLSNLRLREKLRRAEQVLTLEHRVTRCLADAESVSATLRNVIQVICEAQDWECGRYFQRDEKDGVLRYAESWHVPEIAFEQLIARSRTTVIEPGLGLVGRVFQSGQPLWSTDLENDPRLLGRSHTPDMGVRAAFDFPVTAEGTTVGVLAFSTRKTPNPDERLQQVVLVIGSQIGQYLQRKQAEAVLRESEARFRSLTTLSSDWYWEQDAGYRFVEMSDEIDRKTGVSALAHIGKLRWELAAPNMTEADWAAHRAVVETHQPFHDLELCRHTGEGRFAWVGVSGEPIFDTEGRFKGYRGIGKDITARKRAEQLQALEHTVTRCLAEADSEASALRAAIRAVCESEAWECGRYFRVDETADVLRYVESWHVPEPAFEQFIEHSRGTEFTRGAGLAGRAWQSGQPLWAGELDSDPRALRRSHAVAIGLHAMFAFPVTAEGKTIGVLSFSTRKAREPDEGLLLSVTAIGSQTGQYLKRKQAEAVLRESEARFRSLTSLSSDWYWEQDSDYRFVEMDNGIDRKMGASALAHSARVLGKRRWAIAAPNMTEADWTAHRAVVEAHQPFHDLELCRHAADGKFAWISVSGAPIFDTGGRFKGYRGIGKDITVRKRAEQLRALEHTVTRCLAGADSAAAALKVAIRAVCESEGWDCGRYFRVDESAGVLRFEEAWGVPSPGIEKFIERSRALTYAAGTGLVGRTWQSGEPLWIADISQDQRAMRAAYTAESEIRGVFLFPVTSEGKTTGVLNFSSRDIREPDELLLQAVRVIGSQIGQYLHRKQIEETIHTQALQQRLIAEFGQQALASDNLEDVLNRAAELVASTLKVDFANVLKLSADGQQLLYQAAVGWPPEWVGHRLVPIAPGSRLDYILSRGEPLITEDYAAGSGESARLLEYGVRSAAQVPIFGTKVAFGALCAHTREPRKFTAEDVSFLRNVASILAIAIERKNAQDKLALLAQFDTVTALPNRHLFRDRLDQALTQAQRNAWLGALLFIDLDRFKAVNDTHGHAVGDRLLKEVATRINRCLRSGDTVARLSGDEFAAVLSRLAKADDAALVSQKIVDTLAIAFELDGHQIYVSASIGIAVYPSDGNDTDTLVKNADTAMYRAKEQGRNCYRFYLPQMNERLMERMRVESRLRGALERGEYRLHYQPKVRLDTGIISGFEALLRWEQEGRLVPPLEFISILEDTGLIVSVGEWVLRTACRQIGTWKEMGIQPRPIAVNLSARQFQQKELAMTIRQMLHETGVAPELLELELTETLLMSDAEEAVQMLRELKGLGVRLAVDDFGTGYSSLAYLRRFPLDTLKIDRTFIRDAVTNPDDATLTLAIINLAHSMRLKVVAEGVETEGQLAFLRLHGCDEMQGYYFARPMTGEDCTRALVEDRRLQQPGTQPSVGPPALLLVGVSEDDLALLKSALACDEFMILTATNPAAAFETLARHGAAIVISDYRMPGMSGVEFLSKVRKLYPDTVRIVTIGSDDPPTLTGVVNNAGIHKLLHRNWDPARLRAEVREAYHQRR